MDGEAALAAAVALPLAARAVRGAVLETRALGQPAVPQPASPAADAGWTHSTRTGSIGGSDLEIKDLTQRSVRVTLGAASRAAGSAETEPDEEVDVLVVGGAAAGLAASACCQREGLTCVVIEKNEASGDIWRSRYHRLHLHDIIEECHLSSVNGVSSHLPLWTGTTSSRSATCRCCRCRRPTRPTRRGSSLRATSPTTARSWGCASSTARSWQAWRPRKLRAAGGPLTWLGSTARLASASSRGT
mmetsp:Transcript_35936/g.106542  ORF Transcript_35936/g.106542 Transcript_35936/m.106542 type:complete len:245 (+) Transcript_35936:91-825(+)